MDKQVEVRQHIRTFKENDLIVKRGLATFLEVGKALADIRDRKQYLDAGYDTFEQCCQKRYGMARQTVYDYIRAAEWVRKWLAEDPIPSWSGGDNDPLCCLVPDLVERFAAYAAHTTQALREERDQMVDTLKKACDREWKNETPRQVAIIAANAIYWRDQQIADLKRERDAPRERLLHRLASLKDEYGFTGETQVEDVEGLGITELQEALGNMIGWAKYAAECDPFYFSTDQAPEWLQDLAKADAAFVASKGTNPPALQAFGRWCELRFILDLLESM